MGDQQHQSLPQHPKQTDSGGKKALPSKLRDSDLFRKHAEAATAQYSQATLAQEAEADRLRSKAAEKLALRLNRKRGSSALPETSTGGVEWVFICVV